jgi:hypothetical protein
MIATVNAVIMTGSACPAQRNARSQASTEPVALGEPRKVSGIVAEPLAKRPSDYDPRSAGAGSMIRSTGATAVPSRSFEALRNA